MIAMATVAPAASLHELVLPTGVEAFQDCFVRSQDEAGRPWAFVPSASGGMFTNLGASGSVAPYRLLVRAASGGTSVRLIAVDAGPDLARAVEQCR